MTKYFDLAIHTSQVYKWFTRRLTAYPIAGPVIDARFGREPNKSLSSRFLLLPITEAELRPGHKKLARRAVLYVPQFLVHDYYFHFVERCSDWGDSVLAFSR